MSKNVVGLDIGASAVRVVEMTTGSQPKVVANAAVPLPIGAVTAGVIQDPDAVTAAVKQAWAASKVSGNQAVLTLANQSVVIRQVDLDWLPAASFRSALPFLVKDHLPVPVEEAFLDYFPLSEDPASVESGRRARVLLVAAKKDMVNAVTDAVRAAGVDPIRVDITPLSLIRAINPVMNRDAMDYQVLVHIGADVVNIVVHRGGVPVFVRMLPSAGGRTMSEAVHDAVGGEFLAADAAKIRVGLGDLNRVPATATGPDVFGVDAAAPAASSGADDPVAVALRDQVSGLITEVRASLDFLGSQAAYRDMTVSEVVLSGGGARLQGLGLRMANELRLNVQLFDPATLYPGTPLATSPLDPDLTTAIGACVGA